MAFDKNAYNRWYYRTHKYLWEEANGARNNASRDAAAAKKRLTNLSAMLLVEMFPV